MIDAPRHYHHYYHGKVETPRYEERRKFNRRYVFRIGDFVGAMGWTNAIGLLPGLLLFAAMPPAGILAFPLFQVTAALNAYRLAKPSREIKEFRWDCPSGC